MSLSKTQTVESDYFFHPDTFSFIIQTREFHRKKLFLIIKTGCCLVCVLFSTFGTTDQL